MPAYVIPPDNVTAGQSGHLTHHDEIADMLALLTEVGAQMAGVVNGTTTANIAALQTVAAANTTTPGLQPSGDTTGVKDTANIQALLNLGVNLAKLGVGVFYLKNPLVLNVSGQRLYGSGGSGQSGDDAGAPLGTRLKVVAGFTNPNTWSSLVTAAVVMIQQAPGAGSGGSDSANHVQGLRLADFWVDCSAAPAGVDGVATYGNVSAAMIERVGVWQATGRYFPSYRDPSYGAANFPDGHCLNHCLAQGTHTAAAGGSEGFYGTYIDTTFINCHAQNIGTGSDGWYITGNNNRLIGCRGDLCKNGFTFDLSGGSGYADPNQMIGCGTQRNNQNGLNVINTSAAGTAFREAVIAAGCQFGEDGVNGGAGGGGYAGISASGVCLVLCSGCRVTVGTVDVGGGCPAYGIATHTSGTSNGVPTVVQFYGGLLNYVTAAVSDAAGTGMGLIISPGTVTAQGYEPAPAAFNTAPYLSNLNAASAAVSGSSAGAFGALAKITHTNTGQSLGGVGVIGQATGDAVLGVRVAGDTNQRLRVNADGSMAWGPGGAGSTDVNWKRLSSTVLGSTSASIAADGAGSGFCTAEGTNCKQGTATLNGTTAVVVANTSVTANSRIFLTIQAGSGTVGSPYVSARTAGTSFSIKSTTGGDTSTVAYEIFEPAP